MLMYRQVSNKNEHFVRTEDLPEHMQKLLQQLREEEELEKVIAAERISESDCRAVVLSSNFDIANALPPLPVSIKNYFSLWLLYSNLDSL